MLNMHCIIPNFYVENLCGDLLTNHELDHLGNQINLPLVLAKVPQTKSHIHNSKNEIELK